MGLLKFEQLNAWLEKNNRFVTFLFFALFFIVGINIYSDYGMSWDEYAQWYDNGYANYDYVFHNDGARLLNGIDKYHGPAYELFLIGIEKLFKLSDSRDIFLMRHLAIFITCFISSIFFFQIAKNIFNSWKIAIIGFLLYSLSPHIFAHSFYNSKDAVFLAFFTISIYSMLRFHEQPSLWRGLLFALITSITIDIRIIGILIPAISGVLFLIESAWSVLNKEKIWKRVGVFLVYFVLLIPFVILFWPVLWMDPIYHFTEALKENSAYPWNGNVLYFGQNYLASDLPWHYLLFWIFISKPVFYSVLFIIGVGTLLISFVKKPIIFISNKRNESISLIWFFLPLIILLFLGSNVFDTGRHLYFMHGGFVLIALFGLQTLLNLVKNRIKMLYSVSVVLLLLFSNLIYQLVKIHPYQNVYFNCLAGDDMNRIKNNFEFDYWGLGSREVLENILSTDSSKQIKIYAENFPEKVNARILLPEQRKRLIYTDSPEEANYFIVDYRWHKEEDYTYRKETHSAKVGNASLITAFRVSQPVELYNQVQGEAIVTFFTDFEKLQPVWGNNNIVKPYSGAYSGQYSAMVDSVVEFSSGLTITNLDFLSNKKHVVLKASFWRFVDELPSQAKLVVTIVKPDGKSYFWAPINEMSLGKTAGGKKWEEVFGAVDLPIIKEEKCVLNIYLWNVGKKRIFMDDVKVEFIQDK